METIRAPRVAMVTRPSGWIPASVRLFLERRHRGSREVGGAGAWPRSHIVSNKFDYANKSSKSKERKESRQERNDPSKQLSVHDRPQCDVIIRRRHVIGSRGARNATSNNNNKNNSNKK